MKKSFSESYKNAGVDVTAGYKGEELMKKADILKEELSATGIRLYVNTENPNAEALYKLCGFQNSGKAYFMEK